MNADHAADVQKEVRLYITVFVAVAILTLANVAASYMTARAVPGVTIALMIAAVNAVLVARYFMHLPSEGKVIHLVLGITALLFVVLMLLIMFAMADEQGAPIEVPTPVQESTHHVS
jgi:caa(3)-type oxidase subunit IV